MRRISCLVVFDQVTSDAGVGCGIVITIMTNNTVVGNGNVRASQHVVVVVDREGSRVEGREDDGYNGKIRITGR